MSAAARSLFWFSLYLFLLGAVLLVAPNTGLRLIGLASTSEPWLRVLGVVALALGFYYSRSAFTEQREFIRATIYGRSAAAAGFVALAALGAAPAQIALFAACDLAGAVWTARALSTDSRAANGVEVGSGRWATRP